MHGRIGALLAGCLACSGGTSDDGGGAGRPIDETLQTEGAQGVLSSGGVRLREDMNAAELAASSAPRFTHGAVTLYAGYEQVGNNQNPLLFRVDEEGGAAGASVVYVRRHEAQPPDGRLLGLVWDGGAHAYGVYSVDGGGTDLEGKAGWLASYAPGAISGGGPKVSVVGRMRVETGELERATFVISVLSSGRVNSHGVRAPLVVHADGTVDFLGESAHKPIAPDGRTALDCTDYPFDTRYRFTADLSTLLCAESTNCTSPTPCP